MKISKNSIFEAVAGFLEKLTLLKRILIGLGVFIAVCVIFYGFFADIENNPRYLRLGFFLAAITALATLYDMIDRKTGDNEAKAKLDQLLVHIETIAASHKKQAKLSLRFSSANGANISPVVYDEVACRRLLEMQIPRPAQTPIDNMLGRLIMRPFASSPEEEREHKITHGLWEYRLKGISEIHLSLENSGDIAAENIDLFLYLPKELNPMRSLPDEPKPQPHIFLQPPHRFKSLPSVTVRTHDATNMQVHWEIDRINPGIVHSLSVFYLEPGKVNGKLSLPYAASTKDSKEFSGKISLIINNK